jgi:hypothetical protein
MAGDGDTLIGKFRVRCGAQVKLDDATLLSGLSEQMNVHFVGTETGTALAQLREIERRRRM